MSNYSPQAYIAIGSQFENIELVQAIVSDALRRFELGEEESQSIGMAVREAVANAIKHGNRLDPEKKVEIEFGIEGSQVVVRVTDEGSGFDPTSVEDPLAPQNLLRSNGRGIFFMRSFMDEIEYTFRPEGGTSVTMRKRLNHHTVGSPQVEEKKR